MVIVEGMLGHITITGINVITAILPTTGRSVTTAILPTTGRNGTTAIRTIMDTSATINTLATGTASTGGILVFGNLTALENTTTSGDIGDNLKDTTALEHIQATSGLDTAPKITTAALLVTPDTDDANKTTSMKDIKNLKRVQV